MTKEELEAKVTKQKDIIRIANDKIYFDVKEYINSLPYKVGDKISFPRIGICWIASIVPNKNNGRYDGRIDVRVNPAKKDGTRSNREYLIYSYELDSIKKIK